MTTSRGIMWTRRAFTAGQIILIIGLCFYSLMTTTPLVAEHSEWAWSGWALGAMADAAFIMAITADSTLARHGITHLGGWVRSFKWFTGFAVVYLNIWSAVEARDWVGVAIHIIAPALVMLLAEVGPIYTAALAQAERAAGAPQSDYYSGDHPIPHVPAAEPSEPPLADWERELLDRTPAGKSISGPHAVTDYFAQERASMDEYRERSAEAARQMMETITVPVPSEEEAEALEEHGDRPAVSAEEAVSLLGSVDAVADALGISTEPPAERMSNSEANELIEQGWRHGIDPKEIATTTGRHVQTVRRKYRAHEERSTRHTA